MAAATRSFRVHYREAVFAVAREAGPESFESVLRRVMKGPLGADYGRRICRIVDDRADQAMINQSETTPPGVFVEIFHLDSRRELPFVQRQKEASAVASVVSRPVPEDESAMGAAAYLLVYGNHIATIEPFALRVGALQAYFNALFQAAGQLPVDGFWKLEPKVQLSGSVVEPTRGVSRLEIRPIARLVGDAPSRLPAEDTVGRRPTVMAETRTARGGRVVALLEVLGASEADLESVRASMSTDLGLEAKVEITVRRNYRSTPARLDAGDISHAIASLEQDNEVSVLGPDGRTKGGLTTLWKTIEVAEVGGLLPLKNVVAALTSVLHGWGAQGIIDLSGHQA